MSKYARKFQSDDCLHYAYLTCCTLQCHAYYPAKVQIVSLGGILGLAEGINVALRL